MIFLKVKKKKRYYIHTYVQYDKKNLPVLNSGLVHIGG